MLKIRNANYASLGVAFLLCLNSQGGVAADTGRRNSQLDERLIAGKQSSTTAAVDTDFKPSGHAELDAVRSRAPKSRAALLTILGVLIATLAGLVLGNLELLETTYEITLRSK